MPCYVVLKSVVRNLYPSTKGFDKDVCRKTSCICFNQSSTKVNTSTSYIWKTCYTSLAKSSMYATTSFTCRKQVVDVEQQVIDVEHKFYINWQKYFCPLRRVIPYVIIWSRSHGAIVGSMKQNFFTVCGHEVILQQSLFQVLLLSSINSSQREYLFCLLQ